MGRCRANLIQGMEDTQTKPKKQYTLHFILNPSIAQEEIHSLKEKINEKIQALEGQIETSMCDQRLSKLAYEIKKGMSGFVCESVFVIDPEKVQPLNESLKHTGDLIRFIIESKHEPPKFLPVRRRRITTTKKITGEITAKTPPSLDQPQEIAKEKREKINIAEIDKKLDEIIKNI